MKKEIKSIVVLTKAEHVHLFVVSIIAGGVELTGFSVDVSGNSVITSAHLDLDQREKAEHLLVDMQRIVDETSKVSLIEKDGKLYLSYVRQVKH